MLFDGAFRSALVFLNGYFIGRNDNGYAPFFFDLSDFLNYGGKNYLVVRMDASFGDGWFYEGAGIYRHVWLTKTDALHLGRWESFIRSAPQTRGTGGWLDLSTVVQNEGTKPENCRVRWQIFDAAGKVVASADTAPQSVATDVSVTFKTTANIPTPTRWSPETPYLYSAVATVESAGKTRDAERITFGVRDISGMPTKDFFSTANPSRSRAPATTRIMRAWARRCLILQWYRLGVLKDMGWNAVRTSHNMPTPEWVEACDRMGMMMMCETRLMSSNPEGMAATGDDDQAVPQFAFDHLWSMGNEEWTMMHQPQGVRVLDAMIRGRTNLIPRAFARLPSILPLTHNFLSDSTSWASTTT